MNSADKTDAVLDWVRTWSGINGFLALNATPMEAGQLAMQTDTGDSAVKSYIDGSSMRQYVFNLRLMADWSDGADEVNRKAIRMVGEWQDWVSNQFPSNVPDFGNKCSITDIMVPTSTPSLAMVYPESNMAQYSFPCTITYTEEKEF